MNKTDLKERTKNFSIRIIDLAQSFPEKRITRIISDQLVRSACSVGANYRAACRSKSSRDFINKLKIVEEEIDETCYWLELLGATLVSPSMISSLLEESQQLTAIFVASLKTAKDNLKRANNSRNINENCC